MNRRRAARALIAISLVLALPSVAVHAYDHLDSSAAANTLTTPDDRTLAYSHTPNPDAPRVVLIHGAPANSSSWSRLFPHLEGYDVVALDRLGYGDSTSNAELRLGAHAASIEPLLTPGCVVVGHSYGAPVALRLAAEYPDRVAGLVLVAGATDPDMKDAQWFRRAVNSVPILLPESWENANRELLALTDENDAMRPLLTRITARVAALHGTRDPVCPHDSATEHLARELTSAAEVRIDSVHGAGHNLHLSHAEQVASLIDWLVSEQE